MFILSFSRFLHPPQDVVNYTLSMVGGPGGGFITPNTTNKSFHGDQEVRRVRRPPPQSISGREGVMPDFHFVLVVNVRNSDCRGKVYAVRP